MRNPILLRRHRPVGGLLLLASLLVLALAPAVRSGPPRALPPAPAAGVIGSGPGDMLACLGCASIVVGLGGTTVVGVVGFLAAWPEIGIGCGLACYRAF